MALCDPMGHLIVKLVGVYPQGLNRLHDAIDFLNNDKEFKKSTRGEVRLLSSKFSEDHRKTYMVEVQVPFQTQAEDHGSERGVSLGALAVLFNSVELYPAAQYT